MSRGFFVTGTDTGVGKTWFATALIATLRAQGRRVAGMKPVASGCDSTPTGLRNADALALLSASGLDLPYEAVNPYAFVPPIAPHLAAAEADVAIRFSVIERAFGVLAARSDCVVVEAVGGWQVPLGEDGAVADLARCLGLPVLLVVGLRLGCLNHAVLSARDICRTGASLAGWVGCAVDPQFERRDDNLQALQQLLPGPCWGLLPYAPRAEPIDLVRHLRVPVQDID